jgi:saccharopine dehydrogenase-like NADP-dependent oxidoreductase
MQGKAALHDLAASDSVGEIIAADKAYDMLREHVHGQSYGARVVCEPVDAQDPASIERLLVEKPDVVLDLLPSRFNDAVARAAVAHGAHYVNASYSTEGLASLANEAKARNLTLLPECGMDPGIDLVLLGHAVRALDRVEGIITYGAGFPEPDAATGPLKYKITWTFEGVLASYLRAGRVIRDGEIVDIAATDMFRPDHIHELQLEGLGRLEAFPNGDALKFARLLGLEPSSLRNLGRYVLRWPGHCAFWQALVDLHLLDDEPVTVDGKRVDRRRFLAAAIEPSIQYGPRERDVVVVRIDVSGWKNGNMMHILHQIIDLRDLETGHTAMCRTVGYTASIGSQMIGSGRITRRGLLTAVNDIPFEPFVDELQKRGIQITSTETSRPVGPES